MVGRKRQSDPAGYGTTPRDGQRKLRGKIDARTQPIPASRRETQSRRRSRDQMLEPPTNDFQVQRWPAEGELMPDLSLLSQSGSDSSSKSSQNERNRRDSMIFNAVYGERDNASSVVTDITDVRIDHFMQHMELLQTSKDPVAASEAAVRERRSSRSRSRSQHSGKLPRIRQPSKSPMSSKQHRSAKSPSRGHDGPSSGTDTDDELDRLVLQSSSSTSNGATEWFKHLMQKQTGDKNDEGVPTEASFKSDSSSKKSDRRVRWTEKNEERHFLKGLPVDRMGSTISDDPTPRGAQSDGETSWQAFWNEDNHHAQPQPVQQKSRRELPQAPPTDDWDFSQQIFPSETPPPPQQGRSNLQSWPSPPSKSPSRSPSKSPSRSPSKRKSSLKNKTAQPMTENKSFTNTTDRSPSSSSSKKPASALSRPSQKSRRTSHEPPTSQTENTKAEDSVSTHRQDPPPVDSSRLEDRIRNPGFHPSAGRSWNDDPRRMGNLDPVSSTESQLDPDGILLESQHPDSAAVENSTDGVSQEIEMSTSRDPSPLQKPQDGRKKHPELKSSQKSKSQNGNQRDDESLSDDIQQVLGAYSVDPQRRQSDARSGRRKDRQEKRRSKARVRSSSVSFGSSDSLHEGSLPSDVSLLDNASSSDSSGADGSDSQVERRKESDILRTSSHRRRPSPNVTRSATEESHTPTADNRSMNGSFDGSSVNRRKDFRKSHSLGSLSASSSWMSSDSKKYPAHVQKTFIGPPGSVVSFDNTSQQQGSRKSGASLASEDHRSSFSSQHVPFTSVREAVVSQAGTVNTEEHVTKHSVSMGYGHLDGHRPFTSVRDATAYSTQFNQGDKSHTVGQAAGANQEKGTAQSTGDDVFRKAQDNNKANAHGRDYWKSISVLKTLGSFDSLSAINDAQRRARRKSQEFIDRKKKPLEEDQSELKAKTSVEEMKESLTQLAKEMSDDHVQPYVAEGKTHAVETDGVPSSRSVSLQSASVLSEAILAAQKDIESEKIQARTRQSMPRSPSVRSSSSARSSLTPTSGRSTPKRKTGGKKKSNNGAAWNCDDSMASMASCGEEASPRRTPSSQRRGSQQRPEALSPSYLQTVSEEVPSFASPTLFSQDSTDSGSTQLDSELGANPATACCTFTVGDVTWALEWFKQEC